MLKKKGLNAKVGITHVKEGTDDSDDCHDESGPKATQERNADPLNLRRQEKGKEAVSLATDYHRDTDGGGFYSPSREACKRRRRQSAKQVLREGARDSGSSYGRSV